MANITNDILIIPCPKHGNEYIRTNVIGSVITAKCEACGDKLIIKKRNETK